MAKADRVVQIPGEQFPPEATTGPATAPVGIREIHKPVEGLRAADVDASKLRRAVLTLDGWVCPERPPGLQGAE